MNKLETLKGHKAELEKRCAALSGTIEDKGRIIEETERERMRLVQSRIEYREKIISFTAEIYKLQGEE